MSRARQIAETNFTIRARGRAAAIGSPMPPVLQPFAAAFAAWVLGGTDDLTAEDAGAGRITLVRGSGGITTGGLYQEFRTGPGQAYSFTGSVLTSAMSIRFGNAPGNGVLVGQNTNAGAFDIEFTATSWRTFVSLWPVNNDATASIEDMALDVATEE